MLSLMQMHLDHSISVRIKQECKRDEWEGVSQAQECVKNAKEPREPAHGRPSPLNSRGQTPLAVGAENRWTDTLIGSTERIQRQRLVARSVPRVQLQTRATGSPRLSQLTACIYVALDAPTRHTRCATVASDPQSIPALRASTGRVKTMTGRTHSSVRSQSREF
jgi:hypothetical protein